VNRALPVLALLLVAGCADLFAEGPPIDAPPTFDCPLPTPAPLEVTPVELLEPAPAPPSPYAGGCAVPKAELHRLTRVELERTLGDLVYTPVDVAGSFPADELTAGFDNNAAVLGTSPLFTERLFDAVERAVDAGLARNVVPPRVQSYDDADLRRRGFDRRREGTSLLTPRAGPVPFVLSFPDDGRYLLRVRASVFRDPEPAARFVIRGPEGDLATYETTALPEEPEVLEVEFTAERGVMGVELVALNPRENVAAIDYIELDGPYGAPAREDPPARVALLACDEPGTRGCAEQLITRFARRAWRAPLDDADAAALLRVYDDVAAPLGHDAGARAAMIATLLSPRFLHRLELDDGADEVRALTDHELATRLAYFLWSTTPDDRLLALADKGALQDDAILEDEVRRMLTDPRAGALASRFAAQWLDLAEVDAAQRSVELFDGFTPALRHAMRCETEIFFKTLVDENESAHRLIDAERTFVNPLLAEHYGLPGARPVGGRDDDVWYEADLANTGRRGILTHGSVLTLTSNPTRTSPVKRGKWILENLLCIEPPPPPPEVEGLIDDETTTPTSLREQLEQHRADPVCAGCHAMLDPIGFALESFDAIGQSRREDDGGPVDTSGFYFDEVPFDDLHGLADRLLEDRLFPKCVVEQTLTYALGRELTEADACALDELTAQFEDDDLRVGDLFVHVAQSPAFRLRQPEEDR
jgi:hypothetical protein